MHDGFCNFTCCDLSSCCWCTARIHKLRILCNSICIIRWCICVIIVNIIIVNGSICICVLEPVFCLCFFSTVIDNIIFHYHRTSAHVRTDKINSFFYIECIVVHMCIWLSRWIDHTAQIILADVITEDIVDCLYTTEHYTSAAIVMAIIILIQSSVTVVCIPCLSILILACIKGFIILENSVFTFPWPDSCRYSSGTGLAVICWINLSCHTI